MKKMQNLGWILSIVAFITACFCTGLDYINDGKMNDLSLLRWLTYPTLVVLCFLTLSQGIIKTINIIDTHYKTPPTGTKPGTAPLWKLFVLIMLIAGCCWLCIYLGKHIWCFRDAVIYLETFLICFSALYILTKHN